MVNFSALWSAIVWFFRILWACRVSVASATAGLLLFGGVVQAQNLLADTSFNGNPLVAVLYWIGFFLAVFLIWSFPVHFGARQILDDPFWSLSAHDRRNLADAEAHAFCARVSRDHAALILWIPRVLGLVPYVAIGLGLWGAFQSVSHAGDLQEGRAATWLIALLGIGDLIAAICFLVLIALRRRIVSKMLARTLRREGNRPTEDNEDRFAFLVAACAWLTFALFVLAYSAPLWLSDYVARAALIPFLLGSLVLPLSWIARKAHAHGVPYLFLLVAACVLVTAANRTFHDLRTQARVSNVAASRQIGIAEAADTWKIANGCANAAAKCPAALIVAIEGGASRAAFMGATAVGAVLDRAQELHDDPSLASPGRRIFAISGVSGGALGAAIIRTALAQAATMGSAEPPCRQTPSAWFRAPAARLDPTIVHSNWRYCLQALASGDFLSSTFIGLAFRDILAPPFFGVEDRAALLEESWERHYGRVSPQANDPFCVSVPATSLCGRFGYAGGFDKDGGWVPLLLLNGTSVQTGRRVVVSDLASAPLNVSGQDCLPLYPQAYDLFEAMGQASDPQDPEVLGDKDSERACGTLASDMGAPDVRLSTAALVSARFPVISPAGRFHPANNEQYGDSVVDGGYFENAGITTANDIAVALARQGVRAAILWIANEPVVDAKDAVVGLPPAQSPPMGTDNGEGLFSRSLSLLNVPLETLYNTRNGHGEEAAAHIAPGVDLFKLSIFAGTQLTPDKDQDPADLQRCQDLAGKSLSMAEVSMSWWLSPAVQADIDAQLCDERNRKTLKSLMERLSEHASG